MLRIRSKGQTAAIAGGADEWRGKGRDGVGLKSADTCQNACVSVHACVRVGVSIYLRTVDTGMHDLPRMVFLCSPAAAAHAFTFAVL